jgi:thioredoxin-related protein
MKGKVKSLIIFIAVVIILLLPLIINFINNNKLTTISYSKYKDLITNEDFAVIFYGNPKSNDFGKINKKLLSLQKEFDITINLLDSSEISKNDKSELIKSNQVFKKNNVYVFIKDKANAKTTSDNLSSKKLESLINYYYNNIIPKEQIAYKTVKTYDDYMQIVGSKNVTMSVFGRNSCAWCNKFKPIYNDLANEYNLDIYYFDSDSYNKNEYDKIMNSKILYIPASCNDKNKDLSLSSGFGTPLTLFTKKNKVVGCIGGYLNKENLLNKLKDVGMIK